MNIHNRGTITHYCTLHPDCKRALQKWYHDVLTKDWKKPKDVTKDFNKSRPIKNDRVIFEINGSDHRLIAELNYQKGWIFIKFIGTHTEYDKVDAEKVDMYKKKKK
ncbi:MAG: type II toxin-antitoxin system HigB family toxin [Bacteroidia bacterium]